MDCSNRLFRPWWQSLAELCRSHFDVSFRKASWRWFMSRRMLTSYFSMSASHLLNSSCLIQSPAAPRFLFQVQWRLYTIHFPTSISHKVWPEDSLCIDHLGITGLQGTRKPPKRTQSSMQLRKQLWIKRGDRWRSTLIGSKWGQITHPGWVDQGVVMVSDDRRPSTPSDPGFMTGDVSMLHHTAFEKTARLAE